MDPLHTVKNDLRRIPAHIVAKAVRVVTQLTTGTPLQTFSPTRIQHFKPALVYSIRLNEKYRLVLFDGVPRYVLPHADYNALCAARSRGCYR